MGELIIEMLKDFPLEAQVMILSAVPVTELRATIPIAIGMNMDPIAALMYALMGNFIPIIPLLLWLPHVIKVMERYSYSRRFVKWVLSRTRTKSKKLQKYEALGLMLLVSVPLPLTGVWTGSIAAFLFGIPFRLAFPAITIGMFIAGILVTLATLGIYTLIGYVGIPLVVMIIAMLFIVFYLYKRG
ncbi:MAG: hypothetical protein APF76_05515 [Desulfitibacter sp. BRH_c19]|nr:MAG: hypothetical protein APF76_05515 [Desulfitibacter sp. BRH_c19]